MKVNINIYDCKTGKSRIEQVEVEDMVEEPHIIPQEPTLEEKVQVLENENEELKQMDNELVATSWDMDFRMCEIEWTLEDLGIGQEISTMSLENNIIKNTKGSVSNMALTRFEQAKIMIIGGVYNKETLTKQLTTYLNRGYLTQEEYDELIALMEAKDLVVEE